MKLVKKAYAARTTENDPLQSFMYRVSIEGLPSEIGFQKVGGLSREVEVIEYFENMYDYGYKLPGREKVGEISLERGMFKDTYLKDAYEKILTNSNYRRSVTINICDRKGTIRRTFKLAECWFSKYEVGDLDSSSDDVIIETLTMQFEKFV